jgi:hypothetical protein
MVDPGTSEGGTSPLCLAILLVIISCLVCDTPTVILEGKRIGSCILGILITSLYGVTILLGSAIQCTISLIFPAPLVSIWEWILQSLTFWQEEPKDSCQDKNESDKDILHDDYYYYYYMLNYHCLG